MEKIAIIYADVQGLFDSVHALSIPQGMKAEYFPIPPNGNLPASYQSAMASSDAHYKVYLDGSIRILAPDVLSHVIQAFQAHPDIGILGLSGARELSTNGISLTSEKRVGGLQAPDGEELVPKKEGMDTSAVEDVEAIDEGFLATQRDVPWRSDLLQSSAFLGASASLEHRRAGFRSVVLCLTETAGRLEDENFSFQNDEQAVFLDEYSKELYPLVTICIPTYRRPDFFRQALESVLHQTYRNLDIFVTDDSPDDRTEKLIQSYLADGRITYEHHPEYTARDNWQRMMDYDNPEAEYVGWLMDDDLFLPEKISRMVEAYRNHPDVSLVTSYRYTIDGEGNHRFSESRP